LDETTVNDTLGALLKYHDDVRQMQGGLARQLIKKITL